MDLEHLKTMLHALLCSFASIKQAEVFIYGLDWVDRFPYNPAENYWLARHAQHPAGIVLCDYTADDPTLCFQTDVLSQALTRMAGDGLLITAPAYEDCLQKSPLAYICIYLPAATLCAFSASCTRRTNTLWAGQPNGSPS